MPRTFTEWFIALLLFACGLFLAIGMFSGDFGDIVIFSLCLILAGAVAYISLTTISAQPPSVAMPEFLGRRYDVLVREGIAFIFPGLERFIVENFLPEDIRLEYVEVRCMLTDSDGKKISGGSVTVKISVVFVPDINIPYRFRLFLNNGRRKEITKILEGMVGEAVRQYATDKTWEELTFAKSELSAHLIWQLTGMKYADDSDAIEQFLQRALVNGVADVRDLGISIRRLNVVEVEPEGKLKENALLAAEAILQRSAEQTDTDTIVLLAQKIVAAGRDSGDSISLREALEIVRIQRGLADETIVRSSGNGLLDAAALFQNPPPKKRDEFNPPASS